MLIEKFQQLRQMRLDTVYETAPKTALKLLDLDYHLGLRLRWVLSVRAR